MIFICLKMVDLPDSPAPSSSILMILVFASSIFAISFFASALIRATSGSTSASPPPPPPPHMSAIVTRSRDCTAWSEGGRCRRVGRARARAGVGRVWAGKTRQRDSVPPTHGRCTGWPTPRGRHDCGLSGRRGTPRASSLDNGPAVRERATHAPQSPRCGKGRVRSCANSSLLRRKSQVWERNFAHPRPTLANKSSLETSSFFR